MIAWRQNGHGPAIVELALSQPPANEIGTSMLAGLEAFLEQLDTERTKAVIIHSTLASGFCAGADLRELYRELLASRSKLGAVRRLRSFLDRIHAALDRLDTLPVTTIAVVGGVCFGGGFELALTCDLRIAEKTARFAFPELRLGLIPGFGGIPRLRREVGNAVVRDLLLTGRSLNARRAHELGLVSQVVAPGSGLRVARLMAEQTAKFDDGARRVAKDFMKPLPVAELAAEKEHFVRLFKNPTVVAALKKFVESEDAFPYLP